MNQNVHRVSVEIGGTEIEFETGRLAKQASGAVLVKAGETHVLATATAGTNRSMKANAIRSRIRIHPPCIPLLD